MCLIHIEGLWVINRTGEIPVPILSGIDLVLRKNSFTLVIGESGAGKTMLAKSLAALVPSSLEVNFDRLMYRGCQVDRHWLESARGEKIFYIPQNATASLDPSKKIKNQVMYFPGTSLDFFEDLLNSLDIGNPGKILNSYPFQNSEGENQRILLSIALAHNPELLILDEPTSALHRNGVKEFIKLLEKTMDRFGMAVLVLTHDLSLVAEDRYVYVVWQGRIVDSGRATHVFNQPVHEYTREIADLKNLME